MTEETKIYQLVVRQVPVAIPELEDLLKELQHQFGLDAYTARQRLIGPGLVMFGKGALEKTGQITALLHRYGFACWQTLPEPPRLQPSRLRSLEIHNDHILFECQGGSVRLDRGSPTVGVFADISGSLIDKQIKRLLAQNTYRGRDALEPLSQAELVPAIFQGQAVFDFYLLDNLGQPQQAVRVLPGRFNPAGLGERSSLSARGNLEAMLGLVEEYAQDFRLHCDFGLSQLPKCQVQRLGASPSVVEDNLKSLTHYGWLLARLQGNGLPQEASSTPVDEAALLSGIAAAAVVGQPALGAVIGADDTAGAMPGIEDVAREIRGAFADEKSSDVKTKAGADEPVKKDLPSPPERPEKKMSLGRMLTTVGTFLGFGIFVLVAKGDSSLLKFLVQYGVGTGLFTGLLAAFLFWSGLHYIRLKRKIENTPTSKVRSLAMGMVEVHGRARRQYALVAPMTQSACIYYRLRKYRRDKNNKWKLVRDVDSSHVAFQIDDGTGCVVVAPQGASVKAKTRQSGSPGQTPLTFTAVNNSDEDEKWVEDIIYEGTTLYILGFAQPLRAERRSLRERTVEKLRELKLDRKALHRYDADGDGQISEGEWQQARSDAEQTALKEHLAEGTERKRQEEHVIITRPPQRGMPFVIAEAVSEAHLVRNYGLFSLPLMAAGLALAGFAIYQLFMFING
jgi:hypothetical protein